MAMPMPPRDGWDSEAATRLYMQQAVSEDTTKKRCWLSV